MSEQDAAAGWVCVEGASAIDEGTSQAFVFEEDGLPALGFVLRRGGRLYAYRNRCPHWGVDLDLGAGDPYVDDLDRILCRNHGALFLPDSGLCEWGPCAGQRLDAFEVAPEGADAWVRVRPER